MKSAHTSLKPLMT